MHEITNSGTAPRMLHDVKGRLRAINPGGTERLIISEQTAAFASRDPDLRIRDLGEIPDIHEHRGVRFSGGGGEGGGNQGGEGNSGGGNSGGADEKPPVRAVDLLADINENKVTFPVALVAAKKLLGDDWPGGTPKKSVIVAALEVRAAQEAAEAETGE